MHKINVRAFDRKNKYMFYAGSLSAVGDFYMTRYNKKTCDGEEFYERFSGIDYEWMLDAGIKDKKGKSVFAGDIIHTDTNDITAIVKFGIIDQYHDHINGFYLQLIKSDTVTALTPENLDCDFEVIGNIYENPELLA